MNNQPTKKASSSKPKVQKKLPQKSSDREKIQRKKAPVASTIVRQQAKPKVSPLRNGDVRVVHKEYIGDILGSTAFSVNEFAVNPGMLTTFPWLSSLANNYESYQFESLRFCYETESPTSFTGTVLMAIDYDASDPAPIDKVQIMAYRQAIRSAPWEPCCFKSLTEDLKKEKTLYVRNGVLAANQDIKLYDTGNLFICTQGQAGNSTVGELYVEYDVRLMTPQLNDPSIGASYYGEWTGTSNAAPAGTLVMGNLPAAVVSTGTTASVSTWTFSQPWKGNVSFSIVGTGISAPTLSGTATGIFTTNLVNAGTTQTVGWFSVLAQAGQTVVITENNTTISASRFEFSQGSFGA